MDIEKRTGLGLVINARVLTSPTDIGKIVDLEQPGQGRRTARVLLGTLAHPTKQSVIGFYAYYFADEDGLYTNSFDSDEDERFDLNKFLACPDSFTPLEKTEGADRAKKIEGFLATYLAKEIMFDLDA